MSKLTHSTDEGMHLVAQQQAIEAGERCPIEDPYSCLGYRCRLTGVCDYNRDLDTKKQVDSLNAWAERASTALCKVRPLGGPELFLQVAGQSLADPEHCGAEIERIKRELHEAEIAIADLVRLVERWQRLVAAAEPFAEIGRKLLRVGPKVWPDDARARHLCLDEINVSHFRKIATAAAEGTRGE